MEMRHMKQLFKIMDSYYVKTKDEIKKTLDELKEDVANGNLDPYNYGTDDDGNYVYDIYEDKDLSACWT